MDDQIHLIVFPVDDIAAAKSFFKKLLGVDPYVDGAYYVGFKAGDIEIGLDPNGHSQGLTGPLPYLDVADIKETMKIMTEAGAQIIQDAKEVGGGLLIAWLKDKDGNMIGLRQGL